MRERSLFLARLFSLPKDFIQNDGLSRQSEEAVRPLFFVTVGVSMQVAK